MENRDISNCDVIGLRNCQRTTLAFALPSESGGHRYGSIVSNRFNQKERLAMAVAYLKTHEFLTIKQYAKMTQLSKTSAEAELDAFAMDKKKPIQLVIRGKKKVYIRK